MNKRIKELADEAGFIFWNGESWAPHNAEIDWAAQYDEEFQKYTELLIKECLDIIIKSSVEKTNTIKTVQDHFGIKDE